MGFGGGGARLFFVSVVASREHPVVGLRIGRRAAYGGVPSANYNLCKVGVFRGETGTQCRASPAKSPRQNPNTVKTECSYKDSLLLELT